MPAWDTALGGFTHLALRSKIRDDDGVDQLHHFVTVSILVFFAAVTGVVEYAGEPINCWNYGQYHWKHFQEHVNSYCWTHSLFHYPNRSDRSIMPFKLNKLGGPEDPTVYERSEELGEVTFYRWVTIVFILQAFCFKLPNLMWAEFNVYAGSNLMKMVEMLQSELFAKKDERKEKLRQVALFLEQWLRIHRKPHWFLKANVAPIVKKTLSCCTLCIGNNIHNYLSTLYLFTKLTFIFNTLIQFVILSAFLQIDFWNFGVRTLNTYANQQVNRATTITFPLVSLCHFQVYDGVAAAETDGAKGKWVQCILRINIFLEKLFLIEWFWLILLLAMTCVSFCVWCFKILQTSTAIEFVRRFMKLMDMDTHPAPKFCSVEQFVMEYLRNDGVFVLRILAVNTNEVIVAQLVEELWLRYTEVEGGPHRTASMDFAEAETAFTNDKEPPKAVHM